MDIRAIRSKQSGFFQTGQTRDLDFRLASLARLEETLEARSDEILEALAQDLGKPGLEAYLSELNFVKMELRLFRKKLREWAGPRRVGSPLYHFPIRNEIRREPFGCTLLLSPWNYPFQISLSTLISSVGAGNCVILKPSELAPESSRLLGAIVRDSFDPGHVAVVEGGPEISRQLIAEPFDFLFFTGSERVGKVVAKAAAEHLTPIVLELGGKCPVVVDKTADLDCTANRIASAKFFNAGQTCFAPDYVVAHEEIRDALGEKLIEQVKSFYARDLKEDLARIINREHYLRLQGFIDGGDDCFRIGEDDPESLQFAPRIIKKAEWTSPAMEGEIFGPILPVLGFTSEDSLIEKIRSQSHPLALYLFSRDPGFTAKLISAIPSGSVGINDIGKQASNLELPFGGVGGSGMGRYRGKSGFDTFTYERPVSRRWFGKDLFAIQPPYSGKLEKIRRWIK